MARSFEGKIEQMDENRWRIPKGSQHGMRVDGVIYASRALISDVIDGGGPAQVANVATLPGIVGASLAMPDIHWGYGFPIGGVAATDVEEGGVVSPGGVGYDINCGVRLLRTDLRASDVRPRLKGLAAWLFRDVPCGVGVGGQFRFERDEMRGILRDGVGHLVKKRLADEADRDVTESGGCLAGADPDAVSPEAFKRGRDQCGTLGAGNHFVEVRHQVCTDYIKQLRTVPAEYGIELPDRQLVCAPVDSPHGQRYLSAMRAAANFAWCNRQLLVKLVRKSLARFLGQSQSSLGLRQVYDVAHNIAKVETYTVGGSPRRLCVHRKGATRAFPPGHAEIPARYRRIGQPVLIPGDMGTASWVLVGTETAMAESFGSTCHGAGRVMSRKQAIRSSQGRRIDKELAAQGIIAKARGRTGLAEEQPAAYKDVDAVVDCVASAGLARKVARLRPMGVIKG
jgi:tRNA-splicing ligase RtcB